MAKAMVSGRVFISYSHDSEPHRERVLRLANQLRNAGVDCEIDRYYESDPPMEGWPRWMRRMLAEANMVLIVCTETYRRRYEGYEAANRGLGSNWEGAIITQELYEAQAGQNKFLPTCFDQKDIDFIPIELRATTHYLMPRDYERLYRRLTDQPELTKPPLGEKRILGVRDEQPAPTESEPVHNLPFPPNPAFRGRTADLNALGAACQSQTHAAITQTAAITGLGGIGKTQLAIEYAWQELEKRRYDCVLWIRASSIQSLDADLAGLASPEILNLPEAVSDEEAVARVAVLRWLKTTRKRWLLIADNADEEKEISSLRTRIPVRSNGHVIVTSRKERWPGFSSVVLDTLTPEAAIQVLRERIRRDQIGHDAGPDADAAALALEVGFLPLALEQAAAFIANHRWNFATYLEVYRREGARLRGIHQIDSHRYPSSVATTWLVTLDKLSLRAHVILQLASWLAPDEIPRSLFLEQPQLLTRIYDEGDGFSAFDVDEALAELSNLSLIRLTAASFSVHRLLQAVEQDRLTNEAEKTAMLFAAGMLVHEFVPSRSDNFANWGRLINVRPHVEHVLEAAESIPLDASLVFSLASTLATFLINRAEFSEAERFGRCALKAARAVMPFNAKGVATAESNLGCILESQNQLIEADGLLRHSVELIELVRDISNYDRAFVFNNYANLLRTRDELEQAELYYRKAVALLDEAPKEDQASLPSILGNLGILLKIRAKFTESEQVLKRALEIAEHSRGGDHPLVAHALNDLGFLYRDRSRYEEAERYLSRALEIVDRIFESDHLYHAGILDNLGTVMRLQGRREEAEPLLRRALAITEALFGENHPQVAINLVNLGVLLSETGRSGEAERLFRRALKIDESGLGSDHHEVANDLDRLANLLVSIGRLREAETLTKRALQIAEYRLSADHPDTVRLRERLTLLRRHRRRRP